MKLYGISNLPLHWGSCPAWLFNRMKKLAKAINEIIIVDYGKEEFLRRISDPFFFQSYSNLLGFDWNSSGSSTVLCGVLKESLNPENFGIVVCGGKGKTSRRTPEEIEKFGENFSLSTVRINKLKYASRVSAKIDNNLLQDGYSPIYMHTFLFTEKGRYCVIQQGLNEKTSYARRYHWLSDNVKDFVNEPHNAICCDRKEKNILDMTAKESKEARKISVDLVKDNPEHLKKYLRQKTLGEFFEEKVRVLTMQKRHSLSEKDLSPRILMQLKRAYEIQPENYEELIALKGIGAKSVRALALISDLIYNVSPSWNEPSCITRFCWAHGSKDGWPRPVEKGTMDKSIEILNDAVKQSKLNRKEKINAIGRLKDFIE